MKHVLIGGCLTALLSLQVTAASAENTQLLWGDTHLHTSYSTDAFMAGNRSADPDTAYRVAKGEPIIHPFNRSRVQLIRPLDFLVVADHAEFFGILNSIYGNNPDQTNSPFWERWRSAFYLNRLRAAIEDPEAAVAVFRKRLASPEKAKSTDNTASNDAKMTKKAKPGFVGFISTDAATAITSAMWEDSVSAAEKHNEPGKFSALIGWEWSQARNSASLHRVVLSTMDGPTAAGIDPIGAHEAPYPEDLWAGLEKLTNQTGAQFLAIPHNSNLSKGYMFANTTLRGEEITAQYATTRAEWEPLVEATQTKGDSETHPNLSPDDEFANFERFDFYNRHSPNRLGYKAGKGDFIRPALKRGLEIEQRVGVNPYKFGMVGSTDSHTSISSAEETNFWGKMAVDSIPENKRDKVDPDTGYISGKDNVNGWTMSASGRAAVWATENTRQSIFDAMKRKETYATTGPRMSVRLFGGWEFDPSVVDAQNIAEIGYASGVPMGGDLTAAPEGGAPQFLVRAVKDPLDGNLDRVQIIKGWLDENNVSQEKIFDIVWSDGRTFGADGKLPAVGNTVNLKTGAVENSIGAPELTTLWSDPEFDPNQRAFYYVRVLQIPTIRHSQLDATALGMQAPPYEGPPTIQERAYSSPIWYTP
ncbi:MAG: hypothetical protein ACJAVO_002362 [Parvibaculaceae bacterium]|jgi:hypothetical protein